MMFKNDLHEERNYVRNSFAFSEMHTEVFKGKMHNVCYILDYILAKKKKTEQVKQVGKILTTGKFKVICR